MRPLISIIIPVHDGSGTIGQCLESVIAAADDSLEIIVVDDCSNDRSADVIGTFPVRLVRLDRHAGASGARNAGARNSAGSILFFIDADCLLQRDTLARVRTAVAEHGAGTVIGGTYTPKPHDPGFFSQFQSIFVNYFETKRADAPDYIAAHALVMDAEAFRKAGGFPGDFLPIIEDVEFSHRLRRLGFRLVMDPEVQVRHIFNFTLLRSLRNAVRKSRFWTRYSLGNRDLLADSGTASRELKMSVLSALLCLAVIVLWFATGKTSLLWSLPVIIGANAVINQGLIRAFRRTGGMLFALSAYGYYATLYAAAVAAGALIGTAEYLLRNNKR
ncbi:MAG: glycosyltransferase family 2 protein [Nitrospirota bacterium]